ncbi:3'-5' exonuclease [Usitatibacter palustris]|uniref:DNA polymerase III PolC-type n=1 Tax=Usitatibacter palustris TaxID=2732487 RepID=A0A6M4HAS0_9PROT|nr:3'-5' exonuclease [Usitatibacter palustris]QJR16225.1 DNA polymerase III PolC-type [Usitatibacter palustris]
MSTPRFWEAAWQRIGRWIPTLHAPGNAALADVRFVVVDTETSGFNTRSDRLLSIGACAVKGGRIDLAETFYRELRQEQPSDDANILVHGIGRAAQLSGEVRADALRAFLDFASGDPLVAFNAKFDQAFLARSMRQDLGERFAAEWFDLATLPRGLYPDAARSRRTLDDWLAHFGIDSLERHHALGDAFVTAELLLVVLAKARAEGFADLGGLRRAARLGVSTAPT